MEFKHYSVLLEETITYLNVKSDGIYVDGTLGGGGHSYEIAKRLGEGAVSSESTRMRMPYERRESALRNLGGR